MFLEMVKALPSGQVRGRFFLGMTLWIFGTWVSRQGWRVCPALEHGMRQYVVMKDLLGREPTAEDMGY